MLHLAYVAVVVLVPVVPAYLLYKYLPPGQTEVGGPFKGLDIKLSGAFAGYFLVLLIASSLLVFLIKTTPVDGPPCPKPSANRYEVYTVSGKIDLRKSGLEANSLGFSLMPPEGVVGRDGSFRLEIPVKPDQSGLPDFPSLQLDCATQDCDQKPIYLRSGSEYNPVVDHAAKTITISTPLVLERRPRNTGGSQEAKPLPQPSSQP